MALLSINGTILAVIINFLVLVFLLNRFLFKPVLKTLDERKGKVDNMLQEAEARFKAADALQQEHAEKMREARREAGEMIDATRRESDALRKELRLKSEQEIAELKAHATQEVAQLKQKAALELKKEVGNLVVLAASKIVEKSIDAKTHEALLTQFSNELGMRKN